MKSRRFNKYLFYAKCIWKTDRLYIPLVIAKTIVSAALPLIVTGFPAIVIQRIRQGEFDAVPIVLIEYALISMALCVAQHLMNGLIGKKNQRIDGEFSKKIADVAMSMEYHKLGEKDSIDEIAYTKTAYDNVSISGVVNSMAQVIAGILSFSGAAVIISGIGPQMLAILVILIVLNIIIENRRIRLRQEFDKNNVNRKRKIEYILSVFGEKKAEKEARLYSTSDFFSEKFREEYFSEEEAYRGNRWQRVAYYAAGFGLDAVRDFSVYVYVTYLFINGRIDISLFYLYTAMTIQLYNAIKNISKAITDIVNNRIYFSTIFDFLKMSKEEHKEPFRDPFKHSITIRDVSFGYDASMEKALEDVNITIKKGEKIGIVGENGAGKTTLLRLIAGLYDPDKGTIMLDGKNVKHLNKDDYREVFSEVFQNSLVFPATIENNVVFESNEKLDEVNLKEVMLDEKIKELSHGVDTMLLRNFSKDAVNLSGGEEQKLMLLRCLKKKAEIFILDEPVSSLSPLAEYEICENMMRKLEEKTVIVVSHRFGIIRKCDRIIVMKAGKIVEEGSHDSLMGMHGEYYRMFQAQADKFVSEGA